MSVRELTGDPAPRMFFNDAPVSENFNEFVYDTVRDVLNRLYLDNPNTLYRFTVDANAFNTDEKHEITILVWESE